jgi:Cdc6-like AAA superfamily ATPase
MLGAFTPGAPIDEFALFAGRQTQIQRLSDTVMSKGRHAVLFGERGVGKTSLSNIFRFGLPHPDRVVHVYVQCTASDTFNDIWMKALRRIAFIRDGQEYIAADLIRGIVTPDELELALANFSAGHIPVLVFDEFDRVRDTSAAGAMSETIKHLSNSPVPCTIILVGVADNVTDLIAEHHSISRALVQIRMPRMNPDELKEIVTSRLRGTPITITSDALWRISYLASGLPFYSHALGQASALKAIERCSTKITEELVNESINDSFDDLDQSLIDSYVKAITETRKGNIFKQVLAACALADQDDLGRFSAANVEKPLSAIMGRPMSAPAFSFHLNQLCSGVRGLILAKTGNRSHFRFRFEQPMIQPYIIMKSLSAGVINDEILAGFSIERQRSLSI